MLGRSVPARLAGGQQRIGQQRADLVAGERGPRRRPAAGGQRRGAAQAVAVGVGGQDQVGAGLLGPLDDRVEHGRVLGIGDVAGHVGEIAVGRGVRAEDLDVLEPDGRQHRAHGRLRPRRAAASR